MNDNPLSRDALQSATTISGLGTELPCPPTPQLIGKYAHWVYPIGTYQSGSAYEAANRALAESFRQTKTAVTARELKLAWWNHFVRRRFA